MPLLFQRPGITTEHLDVREQHHFNNSRSLETKERTKKQKTKSFVLFAVAGTVLRNGQDKPDIHLLSAERGCVPERFDTYS
ncbi:Sphingosine 1-phosphate receptor 2 [Manis javanica]|nr:Sphingosine 1-phosphate receptor 2 [Manis javanica]